MRFKAAAHLSSIQLQQTRRMRVLGFFISLCCRNVRLLLRLNCAGNVFVYSHPIFKKRIAVIFRHCIMSCPLHVHVNMGKIFAKLPPSIAFRLPWSWRTEREMTFHKIFCIRKFARANCTTANAKIFIFNFHVLKREIEEERRRRRKKKRAGKQARDVCHLRKRMLSTLLNFRYKCYYTFNADAEPPHSVWNSEQRRKEKRFKVSISDDDTKEKKNPFRLNICSSLWSFIIYVVVAAVIKQS